MLAPQSTEQLPDHMEKRVAFLQDQKVSVACDEGRGDLRLHLG